MPLALRGEAGRWWAGLSSGEGPRPAQRRGPSLRVRQMTWPTSWRVASTTKAGASRGGGRTSAFRPMRGRGRLPPVLLLSVQGMEAAAFSAVRAESHQPLSWIVIA